MRTSRKIIGALIAALALTVLPAASAQADPFTMSIDNAILDLGSLSGVRAIDPDLDPPDPPATLTGEVNGNTVTVAKDDFYFPTKNAEVSAGITAEINMYANEDITGTFDSATGKLVLDASLKATVGVLGSTCTITPIELQLSSDNADPYLGEEFAGGIEGNGVISASWAGLPPVTGGGSCGVVAGLIAGPGGIAMSHGIRDFQTCESDPTNVRCGEDPAVAPTKAPKLTGNPAASTEETGAEFKFAAGEGETSPVTGFECKLDGGAFAACDSGTRAYTGLSVGAHKFTVKATNEAGTGPETSYSWTIKKAEEPCPPGTTGTPPNCETQGGTAKLAGLKIQPKTKAVKRGKKAVFKVKVRNAGDAAANGVKVCVTAPKKLVKVKKCVKVGQIGAGKTKTAKFKVTVKRSAKKGKKAVLKFKAASSNAGKKAGKGTVKVR